MKKIVFVSGNMSHSGGTERVLSVIANGLAARGYAVSIISFGGDGKSFFSLSEDIKLLWLYEDNPMKAIVRLLRKYRAALTQEQPDVLVDVDNILCLYTLPAKGAVPGAKWISWEHFNYYYPFPVNHNLRRLVRRLVCRYADQIVVLSKEDMGYYLENRKIRGAITQIYNPTPYEGGCVHITEGEHLCTIDETQDIQTDTVLNKSEKTEKKIVLAAGRLTAIKGFDMLIASWKLLENRFPDWKLVIAGEGEDRAALEQQIADAGLTRVELPGRISDMATMYQQAEFFVLPSRGEGFVMVLLEAMAFSLPAVAFACKAGVKEVISDGENGYLAEPGDIECFADRMARLMEDDTLRYRMGDAARESMARFKTEKILNDWEDMLKSLCPTVSNGQNAKSRDNSQ